MKDIDRYSKQLIIMFTHTLYYFNRQSESLSYCCEKCHQRHPFKTRSWWPNMERFLESKTGLSNGFAAIGAVSLLRQNRWARGACTRVDQERSAN
jgi:hypothetical protein